jgi:hypothetical protein
VIEYFVTFIGKRRNGDLVNCRTSVSSPQPVRGMTDVEDMEAELRKRYSGFDAVAITGWRRFEEKD